MLDRSSYQLQVTDATTVYAIDEAIASREATVVADIQTQIVTLYEKNNSFTDC